VISEYYEFGRNYQALAEACKMVSMLLEIENAGKPLAEILPLLKLERGKLKSKADSLQLKTRIPVAELLYKGKEFESFSARVIQEIRFLGEDHINAWMVGCAIESCFAEMVRFRSLKTLKNADSAIEEKKKYIDRCINLASLLLEQANISRGLSDRIKLHLQENMSNDNDHALTNVKWNLLEIQLKKEFSRGEEDVDVMDGPRTTEKTPLILKGVYSTVTCSIPLTKEKWVVSILRHPSSGNPDHAVLVLEGVNQFGKAVIYKYHFVEDDHQAGKGLVIDKRMVVGIADRKFELAKMLKYGDFVALSWGIQKDQAKRLCEEIKMDKIRPPQYHISGRESFLVRSRSQTAHNCFTWAREKLHNLNDERINLPIKAVDFIGGKISLHLPSNNDRSTWDCCCMVM